MLDCKLFYPRPRYKISKSLHQMWKLAQPLNTSRLTVYIYVGGQKKNKSQEIELLVRQMLYQSRMTKTPSILAVRGEHSSSAILQVRYAHPRPRLPDLVMSCITYCPLVVPLVEVEVVWFTQQRIVKRHGCMPSTKALTQQIKRIQSCIMYNTFCK